MKAAVHTARRHDSALKHVTGQAVYIDDMPEPPGTLHGAVVLSTVACGRLVKTDFSAASAMPGVVAVLGPRDIPGRNDVAAIAAVETEFKPIDDWRGSAAYRLQAARNLLRRLELRIAAPGYAVEVEAL